MDATRRQHPNCPCRCSGCPPPPSRDNPKILMGGHRAVGGAGSLAPRLHNSASTREVPSATGMTKTAGNQLLKETKERGGTKLGASGEKGLSRGRHQLFTLRHSFLSLSLTHYHYHFAGVHWEAQPGKPSQGGPCRRESFAWKRTPTFGDISMSQAIPTDILLRAPRPSTRRRSSTKSTK